MRKCIGILCVCLLFATPAFASVCTFDDITTGTGSTIPAGYGGLNWSNTVLRGTLYPDSGYNNGAVSGDYVTYGGSGTITSVAPAFDFTGLYLTAAWNTGLNVRFRGFQGVMQVYDQTVTATCLSATWYDFAFLGIDKLMISSSGGVDYPPYSGGGTQYVIDNFTINETSDPVPLPGSLALLGLGLAGLAVRRRKN